MSALPVLDIGIHVDGDLDRAFQTVDSVRRSSCARIMLLLEPDVGEPAASRLGGLGYRLKHIVNHGVFAYVRHPRNTWRFEPGRFYDPRAWSRSTLPPSFSAAMLGAHQEACRSWLAR